MKKFGFSLFYIFFFAWGILAQQTPTFTSVKKIIVDAGHGLPDIGARGTITNEATINLQVGLKLAKALRDTFPTIKILETRTTPELPVGFMNPNAANRYRAEFANKSGAELFIALHCNSAGRRPGGWYEKRVVGKERHTRIVKHGRRKRKETYYTYNYKEFWVENKVKGTETYIWAAGKISQKINSMKNNEENYGEEVDSTGELKMPDPNDPVERARMLLYARKYFDKSYSLASMVEKGFTTGGRLSRGVQQRNNKGIWVLQATGMPSILVEMGFISNKEEESYLMSETGQAEIVKCIVSAVKDYIAKYGNIQPRNN
jgi:N-acetylmuramoyl-L-alanine amidase